MEVGYVVYIMLLILLGILGLSAWNDKTFWK